MTAPIHTECTETPHAPCRPSTGTASSVNDASQASATAAQARPYRSACAVSSGAATRTREIPTLLPTSAMATAPAATLDNAAPPGRGGPDGGVSSGRVLVTQPLCRDNGPMGRSIDSQAEWSISGADFLQLDRADAPDGGLADWLAQQLRRAISDGRLPVGNRLPATRLLAG